MPPYTGKMTDDSASDSCVRSDQPGKVRTFWHPLLVRLLAYTLDPAFKVEEEVSVGKLPLRVDILLVRRESGQLPEATVRDLAELLPLLNRFTLIEFKGPTDTMERGDFGQLLGCSHLWHSQQSELVPREHVSVIVVAPAVNGALQDDLRLLGCEISLHEPGIFRVAGLPFTAWLVETDVMAERGQPILSLVSRVFLNNRQGIIDKLAGRDRAALERYRYMVQQIKQFRGEEDIAMHETLSQNLEQLAHEFFIKTMEEAPVEERLRGLSPEERLRGLQPEERVRGLSLEERFAGLTEEEKARLRELFQRKQSEP